MVKTLKHLSKVMEHRIKIVESGDGNFALLFFIIRFMRVSNYNILRTHPVCQGYEYNRTHRFAFPIHVNRRHGIDIATNSMKIAFVLNTCRNVDSNYHKLLVKKWVAQSADPNIKKLSLLLYHRGYSKRG